MGSIISVVCNKTSFPPHKPNADDAVKQILYLMDTGLPFIETKHMETVLLLRSFHPTVLITPNSACFEEKL